MRSLKALFVTTETNEVPKYAQSFESVNGNEADRFVFTHRRKQAQTQEMLDNDVILAAKESMPQVIVYLGACAGYIPSPEVFAKLKSEIAPTVLMCSDAGDANNSPWGALLKVYDQADSFNVVVAIDGRKDWEFSDRHITELTPIDYKLFRNPPTPHKDREMKFGFAGNIGSHRVTRFGKHHPTPRRFWLEHMANNCGLLCRNRSDTYASDADETYKQCVDFLCDSRITPNFCETGSHEMTHVKGRVIEVGLAGGCLLEQKGSPTCNWFESGVDYLEWEFIQDVEQILERLDDPEESQQFGTRLREKVLANHTPEKFWSRVMARL